MAAWYLGIPMMRASTNLSRRSNISADKFSLVRRANRFWLLLSARLALGPDLGVAIGNLQVADYIQNKGAGTADPLMISPDEAWSNYFADPLRFSHVRAP